MAQQPPLGQGLLIIEDSRSHSNTPQRVGLLWMSDQLLAETSTWQHTTLNRQTSMPPAGFELIIPATERPQTYTLDCSHWDQPVHFTTTQKFKPNSFIIFFLPSLLTFIHLFCLPLILYLIHTFLSSFILSLYFLLSSILCCPPFLVGHHKFITCFVSCIQTTHPALSILM
jgi:hypothetical protein